MKLSLLEYVLWFCEPVLQILILVSLYKRRLFGRYRLFTSLNVFLLFATCVEFFSLHLIGYKAYYWTYWSCIGVIGLLGFFTICELLTERLKGTPNLSSKFLPLIFVVVAALVVVSLHSGARFTLLIEQAESQLRVLQTVLLLVFFIHFFGVADQTRLASWIACGFGVLNTAFFGLRLLVYFIPSAQHLSDELWSVSNLFCAIVWTLGISLSERSSNRRPVSCEKKLAKKGQRRVPAIVQSGSRQVTRGTHVMPRFRRGENTAAERPSAKENSEDRFELGEILGFGSMGFVYRAYDRANDQSVAVKFLHPFLRDDPTYLKRLRREALLAARLDHKNICKVYGIEETPKGPLLVMEIIEGKCLEYHLVPSRNRKETLALLEVFIQVSDALEHAHSRNVIHRDIKPSNVILNGTGQVKVVDFGIAKLLYQLLSTLTGGQRVGTLAYTPPEQLLGGTPTYQSDVYSFGCLMYAAVTGLHPFQNHRICDIEEAIKRNALQRPSTINSRMPAGLEAIICRAMHRDLNVRYKRAADIGSDLRSISSSKSKVA